MIKENYKIEKLLLKQSNKDNLQTKEIIAKIKGMRLKIPDL